MEYRIHAISLYLLLTYSGTICVIACLTINDLIIQRDFLLYAINGKFYVILGTFYAVHGTFYTVHGTLYVVHWKFYTIYGTLYTIDTRHGIGIDNLDEHNTYKPSK